MTIFDMIKNLAQRNSAVNSADVLLVFAELDETKAQLAQERQRAEVATQCIKENVQAIFLIRQALEEAMGCTAYLPASEYSGPTAAHDAKYIADAISGMRRKLDAGEDRIAELEVKLATSVQVTDGMAIAFCRAQSDSDIGEDDMEEIKIGLRAALCNVTAPPAPAVPVLITEDEQEEAVSDGYADSFRGGWNACRAAMLATAPEAMKK